MIRISLSGLLGERRWTQKDLAEKTGISAATINAIYNDLCVYISLENLDRICEVLKCTPGDLLKVTPNSIPLAERINDK